MKYIDINDDNIQEYIVPYRNLKEYKLSSFEFGFVQGEREQKFFERLKELTKIDTNSLNDRYNEYLKLFPIGIRKDGEKLYWNRKFDWITIVDHYAIGSIKDKITGDILYPTIDLKTFDLIFNCGCNQVDINNGCPHIAGLVKTIQMIIESAVLDEEEELEDWEDWDE